MLQAGPTNRSGRQGSYFKEVEGLLQMMRFVIGCVAKRDNGRCFQLRHVFSQQRHGDQPQHSDAVDKGPSPAQITSYCELCQHGSK